MMRHHTALSLEKSSHINKTGGHDHDPDSDPDLGIAAFLGFYEKWESKLFLLALIMSFVFISDIIALLKWDTWVSLSLKYDYQ